MIVMLDYQHDRVRQRKKIREMMESREGGYGGGGQSKGGQSK